MSVHVIRFNYPTPPLTANQRLHWRKRAELTRQVRTATAYMASEIPELERCAVTLTWYVADKRRRDADNLVPTLKACCDGLVDAELVKDDTPDLMTKHMPVIRYEKGCTPHLELRIEAIA